MITPLSRLGSRAMALTPKPYKFFPLCSILVKALRTIVCQSCSVGSHVRRNMVQCPTPWPVNHRLGLLVVCFSCYKQPSGCILTLGNGESDSNASLCRPGSTNFRCAACG